MQVSIAGEAFERSHEALEGKDHAAIARGRKRRQPPKMLQEPAGARQAAG